MFDGTLNLNKFIAGDRLEVFRYFTEPRLIEEWSYPDGMELQVPQFEARRGGRYHYIHSSEKGDYVCTGYLREFVPGERVVSVDRVVNPEGELIFRDLVCEVELESHLNGTEVSVTQTGFPDARSLSECEQGWSQSLDHLERIFNTHHRDDEGFDRPHV